jgi:effector-binding domain-containing protein
VPAEQLRGMLRLKRAELQQQIEQEQARLAQVEARLRQIEQEDTIFPYDIVIKRVEPQLVAAIRSPVATYPEVGNLTAEIYTYLARFGVDGIDGALWHEIDQPEQGIDAEGVVFIDRPVPSTERIKVYTLPAIAEMACVVHHGAYMNLSRAYIALDSWIKLNGYRICGPARDIYHRGGEVQDDDSFVTEIQTPVTRDAERHESANRSTV